MGILPGIGTFIAKLLDSKSSLPPGGAGPFGEFDAKNFVESNLSKFEHNPDNQGLKNVTQGIGQLFGLGKLQNDPLPAAPQATDFGDRDNPMLTKDSKPLGPVQPTGRLDYLDSVLGALGSNQGQ